jgi:hypothetical protein
MPSICFLDESGDLGFDFEEKNPSRFLTISVLVANGLENARALRRAVQKTLGRKVNRRKKKPEQELKGCWTDLAVKQYFYNCIAERDFGIYALSLDKQRVVAAPSSGSADRDQLYTRLARSVVRAIPIDSTTEEIQLIVDKSKGKAKITEFDLAITDEIQSKLNLQARLTIYHADSVRDRGLSAADLFCWGIFRKHEYDDTEWFDVFSDKVKLDEIHP